MTTNNREKLDHYISTEIENLLMLKCSIETAYGSMDIYNFQNIRVKQIS